MKLFVVASANNINSDIDLSEPFLTEARAAERLESDYKNAVERFFGEDQDSIAEEDEMTISESGYTVYHSKSQNLEFAQICEIDVPDLAPSFAMTMAAANLEASDHRSRGRAFAKCVDELAAKETYSDRGHGMLSAIRNNDLEAFIIALTGWDIHSVMTFAHLYPDGHRVSELTVDAEFVYRKGDSQCKVDCKVDMQTMQVFDIHTEQDTREKISLKNARVRFPDGGSFYCVSKAKRDACGSKVVFWYDEQEAF